MKKIRVEDAVGQTLCHDLTGISASGAKGVVFRRGHVIMPEDIPVMLDIGKGNVFIWEPSAGEVHEDDAAIIAANALCGEGVTFDEAPSEGKLLMYAGVRGLFCVNSAALRKVNSAGDYTVACLPGYTGVEKGSKLGGIRIVPLVTKKENTEAVAAIAKEFYPVFTVLPYKELKCGVIITGSEVYYGRIEDKFESVMRKKLGVFGARILGVTKCPDDLNRIIEAVENFASSGAELILLTGGMSVDPDDLTPSAIRGCGASVISQGVPMQPGNMLTVAYRDGTVLVGVPGASMHSPVTSLDVFLPRIFAGLEISKEDLLQRGEGGFCLGCKKCTYPVCYFGR